MQIWGSSSQVGIELPNSASRTNNAMRMHVNPANLLWFGVADCEETGQARPGSDLLLDARITNSRTVRMVSGCL